MSKLDWNKLDYSNEEAEELSKLETTGTNYHYGDIDVYSSIKKLKEFMEQIDQSVIDKLHQPIGYVVTTDDIVDAIKKI